MALLASKVTETMAVTAAGVTAAVRAEETAAVAVIVAVAATVLFISTKKITGDRVHSYLLFYLLNTCS